MTYEDDEYRREATERENEADRVAIWRVQALLERWENTPRAYAQMSAPTKAAPWRTAVRELRRALEPRSRDGATS